MSELACVIPIRTQDPPDVEEDAIIAHALSILERRMRNWRAGQAEFPSSPCAGFPFGEVARMDTL